MKRTYTRPMVVAGLVLASTFSSSAIALAAPSLGVSINPAPAGSNATAVVSISELADVEAFSLELNFSSGSTLSLPASNWFTRGSYFPSAPFGSVSPVELNSFFTGTTGKKVYLVGLKPTGSTGALGSVTFTVNPQAGTGASQVLSLSGEYYSKGSQTAVTFAPVTATFLAGNYPNITVSPASQSFGAVATGSQSAPKNFTVSNPGSGVLSITSVALTGVNPGDFLKQNDHCSGMTIQPNGSCTVEVSFAPTTATTKSANLSILSNALNAATMTSALRGNDIFTLTFTAAGTGSGTVTSTPSAIACNTNCSAQFDLGTSITLNATSAEYSLFNGWGGDCSGKTGCSLVMDANKSVTATFDKDTTHSVMLEASASSYYPSVSAAYLAAQAYAVIKVFGTEFNDDLIFDQNKSVTIHGGYNSDYSVVNGTTDIKGKILIRQGTIRADHLNLK